MSEDNKKKPLSSTNAFNQSSLGGIDSELVSLALTELNITRKSTLLYPLGHDQVKQSSLRASNRLDSIFATTQEFKIGVAEDTLILAGETLDPLNSSYKELASSLTKHGIVVLTISKGIQADELAVFLSILVKSYDHIQTEGGMVNCLHQSGVQHIQVTLVDYEKFKITDESEIIRGQTGDSADDHQSLWQNFAAQLLDNPSGQSTHGIEPHHIAMLLNRQPEKATAILRQFEKLISKHLQKDKPEPSIPVRKKQESMESISGINTLLQELNPQLRHQFLTSTLNQCDQVPQTKQTQKFMSQLSQDIVAEMLQKANQKDGRISQSLLHLIEKISPTINGDDRNESFEETLDAIDPQTDKFQELFNQEDYEKYVSEDYNQTLLRLRRVPSDPPPLKEFHGLPSSDGDGLDQPQLDQHILRALKGLMDHCQTSDAYDDYSAKVVEIGKEKLSQRDFGTASYAIEIFNQHITARKPDEIINIALAARAQLASPKIMNDLIQILYQSSSKPPPAIEQLLKAIGPKIIPPLVDMFMESSHGERQHIILMVLKQYKKESVAAAHKLIQRDNIEQIKRMIFLIRQIDDRASSTYLRTLAAHVNQEISAEALAALLYFGDHWGIFFLRDRLNAENPADISQSITIAGDYRIKAMVPDLTARLKFKALSKAEIKRNADLVTALGKIGDAAAIPSLTKLTQNAWSLYRQSLRELKVLTFKTLKGYPPSEIKGLLEIGRQTKDKTIQQICSQLAASK